VKVSVDYLDENLDVAECPQHYNTVPGNLKIKNLFLKIIKKI